MAVRGRSAARARSVAGSGGAWVGFQRREALTPLLGVRGESPFGRSERPCGLPPEGSPVREYMQVRPPVPPSFQLPRRPAHRPVGGLPSHPSSPRVTGPLEASSSSRGTRRTAFEAFLRWWCQAPVMASPCHICGTEVAAPGAEESAVESGFECADCGELTCPGCKSIGVARESDHCQRCRG